MLAIFMALVNLVVIPGFTGLTLGKWATGLRIERNDGGGKRCCIRRRNHLDSPPSMMPNA